jgi:hypothetical protein
MAHEAFSQTTNRLKGKMGRQKNNQPNAFETPSSLRNSVVINPDDFELFRRFRSLPAEHPLVRAWFAGRITDPMHFNAGNIYRVLYEKANDPGGIDSSQAMNISRSHSGDRATLRSAEMEHARRSLGRVERRIPSPTDRLIVQTFCGRGMPAQASLRSAGLQPHPNGVWDRIREALGWLREAVHKAGVESGPDHGAVAQYLQKTA